MSLFAAALGLGIYHAATPGATPRYVCYAGLLNPAGPVPPDGILSLGSGAVQGVPHVRLEYDDAGRVQRMKSVDAAGKLCALPGSQVAEQRLSYDAAGRLVRKENRDARGSLVADAQGVAQREFERDARGRVVRTRFRDAAGGLKVAAFPGYAECRVSFDAQGRPLRVEHLDAAGRLTRNAAGEEVVQYRYGDDGAVTRSNYVAGKLADNYAGVAQEELCRCDQGTCRSWRNAAGEPVVHPGVGAAALRHMAAGQGSIERRCFLEADGSLCDWQRACAEHLVRLNPAGAPEWECYGGADGQPVNHPALGYAERLCQYAPDGRLEREYFWDAQGRPASMNERRHVDTHAGAYTLTLHSDGSTVVQPE